MTTREAEWTDDDRAAILALDLYRSWLCPLHGGLLSDCTAHDDVGPQFEAKKTRCRAQDTLLEAMSGLENVDRPGALLWRIEKTEGR